MMSSGIEEGSFDDSTEGLDSDLEVAAVLARGTQESRSLYRAHTASRNATTPARPGSTASRPGLSPFRPSTVMSNAPRNNTMTVTPSAMPSMSLHQVAARGEVTLLKELIKEHNVNEKDELGLTPLMWAAANDQMETVRFLLNHGVDCNVCGNDNQTALHLAVSAGYDRMAKCLLSSGLTNVNQRTLDGNTALLYAVFSNRVACVKLLLDSGADFLLTNCNGHSAPALALNLGHRDIKLMIDAHMLKLLNT